MIRAFPLLLLVCVTANACATRPRPAALSPRAASPAAVVELLAPKVGQSLERITPAINPGVPHASFINRVVVAPDGTAALTADRFGSVRYWASLDGRSAPRVLPVRNPRGMALARGPHGLTIAVIDAVGAVRILAATTDGAPRIVATTHPSLAATRVVVLAGGDRIVALTADHRIELMSRSGRRLARLERFKFRPMALHARADGRALVAVEAAPRGTGLTLHRIAVTANTLTLQGQSAMTTSVAVAAPGALSPSGRTFAIAGRQARRWRVFAVDTTTGVQREVPLGTRWRHEVPTIGFLGDDRLAVRAKSSQWVAHLDAKKIRIFPLAMAGPRRATAHAFASGRIVAGHGTWIQVFDAKARASSFHGYGHASASTGAISPKGRYVAWLSGASIHVESLTEVGASVTHRNAAGNFAAAAFADDDHLVTATRGGSLAVVRWRDGHVLATASVSLVSKIEVAPRRGLIRVSDGVAQTWVFELSKDRTLRGPHVIADGARRAGLVDDGTHVLWTLGSDRRLRRYSLADLRRGLSQDETLKRGKLIRTTPNAVDQKQRMYARRHVNGKVMLQWWAPGESTDASRQVEIGPQAWHIEPSPNGEYVAVLDKKGLLSVVRPGDGSIAWRHVFPTRLQTVRWSANGLALAASGPSGSAVFTADGRALRRTCGTSFESRRSPPPTSHRALNNRSVCEL